MSKELELQTNTVLSGLGLRELLQRYADERWVTVHMTPEQAAGSVLDCFNVYGDARVEVAGPAVPGHEMLDQK